MDFSGAVLVGGDVNFDLVFFGNGDIALLNSIGLTAGASASAGGSGGLVLYYDTPTPEDAAGIYMGVQGTAAWLGGVNGSYSYSNSAQSNGQHSQNYYLGAQGGAGASVSYTTGFTSVLWRWP